MAQYVFTMNRVGKVVPPKRRILRDIALSFFPGAKIGVLGLNGAGKSTLLKIMGGIETDIEGEAVPLKGLQVGFLPQEPQLDADKDVRGNVEEGLSDTLRLLERFNDIAMQFAEPMADEEMNALLEEQGRLQNAIDACGGWEVERKLEIAFDALRLPPWNADVTTLSGGERRRVALCRLLLAEPEMLLLDEPTNHLDAESVAWLERYLDRFPGTVVAITHDRYFLDNVAGWILELDRGYGIPWEGNYTSWLEQKEARLAQEAREQAAHRKTIAAELEWVRANPRARQAKGRARLQRFDDLQAREFQSRNETNEIYIPPGPRLGDLVVEVEHLGKGYGERLLIDDLSFSLPPGGIVGVIGANGAGKTTLFNIITGREAADRGPRSGSGTPSNLLTSIKVATRWPAIKPCGKRSPTARIFSRSVTMPPNRGPMSGASTSRGRISRNASENCPVVSSSSPTIAGFWIASPHISSPSRATAMSSGSQATTRITSATVSAASAKMPVLPTGSSSSRSYGG